MVKVGRSAWSSVCAPEGLACEQPCSSLKYTASRKYYQHTHTIPTNKSQSRREMFDIPGHSRNNLKKKKIETHWSCIAIFRVIVQITTPCDPIETDLTPLNTRQHTQHNSTVWRLPDGNQARGPQGFLTQPSCVTTIVTVTKQDDGVCQSLPR